MLTGKNIIGERLSSEGSTTFHGENPATAKKIQPAFYEASPKEINQAINLAFEASQEYRNKSGKDKAALLEAIADEILATGDSLIQKCAEESGLPGARIIGERGRTMNQLKLFATLLREGSWVDARIDLADEERKPLPKPDIRSMLKPLGVVGVFGASNFPLAFSVAGGDTTSALAAGCPVIFKAHPSHPATCEIVGLAIQRAIKKTGMPQGVFSMLHGQSTDVGLSIVRHPKVSAIGFTGSYRGGKAIFDEANKRSVPIPVYAEMGSSNPVFILPGALKERSQKIADDLTASVTMGVGQFCTNPGLIFIEQSEEATQFVSALGNKIREASSGVMLNGNIRNNFEDGLGKLSNTKGVNTIAKGKDYNDQGYGTSAHLLHTDAFHFINDEALQEEVFGPSTLAVTIENKDQLIKIASELHGHLTITLHGTEDDLKNYKDVISLLEQKAGRLIINGYPTGVEVCDAMVHGGPFPATTDSRSTSVGTAAIKRFTRPISYQGFPDFLLPEELRNSNPLNIWRLKDGQLVK
jgi:NADP-dependent aldehyde dehydrogenase